VGDFWGLMLEKAVHCLGIWHYGWAWNLASKMDGTSSEAKPAALGYVLVPRFSTGTEVAPLSWTPDLLSFRSPQWQKSTHVMRRNSAGK
jgi:hypothetical protein